MALVPVTSYDQLTRGAAISVRSLEGNIVFNGKVVGEPYRSRSQLPAPDMVPIMTRARPDKHNMFLAQLGIGTNACSERQTFIVTP